MKKIIKFFILNGIMLTGKIICMENINKPKKPAPRISFTFHQTQGTNKHFKMYATTKDSHGEDHTKVIKTYYPKNDFHIFDGLKSNFKFDDKTLSITTTFCDLNYKQHYAYYKFDGDSNKFKLISLKNKNPLWLKNSKIFNRN